jgi:hypothetical protein
MEATVNEPAARLILSALTEFRPMMTPDMVSEFFMVIGF